MRILISPAKKMKTDADSLPCGGLPRFLSEAKTLLARLRALEPAQRKALWRCNDSIAAANERRLEVMDLETGLTPAILSYEGIQYRYMAPGVFTRGQYRYISEHLRILSGFYGLLRPFDGVTPYRLEMQAKLPAAGFGDLYAFWGDKLARQLDLETGLVLDLASKEYSRAVTPHLPARVRRLTCTFGSLQEDRLVEKGTLCKMARGEMVRWLAEEQITRPEEIRAFRRLGYVYSHERSSRDHSVFILERPASHNA